MIYTITFNPALDYYVTVDGLSMGRTNRTQSEYMLPGGKGINVSTVLSNLGVESTALGFVAGFTGDELTKRVQELGIKADFICLKEGQTRINVKILNHEGTEINGMGPAITQEGLEQLYAKIDEMQSKDTLILAGSIPSGVSQDIDMQILQRVKDRQVRCVVDATGKLLKDTLCYHPFLIKPNHQELGELFEVQLSSREEVIPYAKKLQELGAQNVLVSLAGEGAVLVDETGVVYESAAPKGTLVNGVGAGDSMVAGFLYGYEQGEYKEAFAMALAAGSASAFSSDLATGEQIREVRNQITI